MIRWRAIVVASIVVAALSGTARAAEYYLTRVVNGTVLAWLPFDNRWRTVVKGQKLPEHTLVQVTQGARLEITSKITDALKNIGGDELRLTISSPMVLRLEGDVTRHVELSALFLRRPPDVVAPDDLKEASTAKPLFNNISEAWTRLAATFAETNAAPKPAISDALDKQKSINLGLRANRIHLYMPTDGVVEAGNGLPSTVRLLWRDIPVPGRQFAVYRWKATEPRGDPITVTDLTRFEVKIPDEGNYFVQVTTTDQRWQSPVRLIHFALPVYEEKTAATKDKPSSMRRVARAIELVSPPAGFMLLSDKGPKTSVTFAWESRLSLGGGDDFNLIIEDIAGNTVYRGQIHGVMASVELETGDYRWHVEEVLPPEQQKLPLALSNVSDDQRLSIKQSPKDARVRKNILSKAMNSNEDQRIFFDKQ